MDNGGQQQDSSSVDSSFYSKAKQLVHETLEKHLNETNRLDAEILKQFHMRMWNYAISKYQVRVHGYVVVHVNNKLTFKSQRNSKLH